MASPLPFFIPGNVQAKENLPPYPILYISYLSCHWTKSSMISINSFMLCKMNPLKNPLHFLSAN
jgi:hypothetical protein